ncbi:MAG: hypothetical protein HY744_29245 [Deltaproteobacteria bacterium]|nr:hypothetical protein [Deltaproteobacteria bacterium]
MRKLRLVVSRATGRLPALIAATVVPVVAVQCGSDVVQQVGGAGGSSGAQGTAGQGTGQAGSGGLPWDAGTGGGGGPPDAAGPCPPGLAEQVFEVEIPPEGVLADTTAICAEPASNPVASNRAARVTLVKYSEALNLATGHVAIEPSLLASVVGTPSLSVVEAGDAQLLGMEVSEMKPAADGFTFAAQWPLPFGPSPYSWTSMTVKTTFELACPSGPSRVVESLTIIHLCAEVGGVGWVSSGDTCIACNQVCEMAPSPIVPAEGRDSLPLSRALRLSVVAVARVGRSLFLRAEHDGGAGLDYEWQQSSGRIERLAPDIACWTPACEPGSQLVQVAVRGPELAAVASFATSLAA